MTSITQDGTDSLSVWADLSIAGNNLTATDNTKKQPIWTSGGILFNGTTNFLTTTDYVQAQPVSIYIVIKQVTWTINDRFINGRGGGDRCMIYSADATPGIAVNGGTSNSTISNNLAVNTWGVIRVIFDGASSKFTVDDHDAITGSWGTNAPTGFTLGANQLGTAQWSNIQVKELIYRSAADSDAVSDTIYTYLVNKYGL